MDNNNNKYKKIKDSFINNMKEKGYQKKLRENMISPIFKTTFTLSGGPNLALDYFDNKTINGNYYIHQPCIRHWDIFQVGDNRHLSFFDMLVTTSMNGFDRKKIISDHVEYIKNNLKFDFNKIYVTYFGGGIVKGKYFEEDFEMKKIWLELGINESHIFSCTKERIMEAFVANSVEPVGGYRSELFYNFGNSKPKNIDEFFALENDGEILEFWTHVKYMTLVNVDKNDKYEFKITNNKVFAAGFGLQRVVGIIENKQKVYDSMIFNNIKESFMKKSDSKESFIAIDHIRGILFLINDNVLELKGKKNKSRKYVFRKYVENFRKNFNKIVDVSERKKVYENLLKRTLDELVILNPEVKVNYNRNFKQALNLFLEK